jgi:predicted dehydrogenase
MLRGAIIGVGHVARNGHIPGWRGCSDVTIAAAADARPDGRDALLAAFPEARWYDSGEILLAAETLDFVDICTPPALHAVFVTAALEAGCHVFCEKPLVLAPGGIPPLAKLAREKARALVTVHNWKHAPALEKVAELLREGAIGALRRARWETRRTKPAVAVGDTGNWRVDPSRSGGGILVDHGWHAFYVLRDWLGGPPSSLSARLTTEKHREFPLEDTAAISLEWSGAMVEVFLTWAAPERGNRIEIEGERGALSLDGGRLELLQEGSPRVWNLSSIAEGSHHPEWFRGVAEEFLKEIREPAVRGRNLEEATLCSTLLALAQESSRQGGVTIPVPSA